MPPRAAVVTGLLALLSIVVTGQQKSMPEAAAKHVEALKKELPEIRAGLAALQNAPEPSSGVGSLPAPSMTEPFEIGEALYDPGRMADAVVSLLALMQVAVVPDGNANTKVDSSKGGLTLSESEVHALINLGREDFTGIADMDALPYGFAQLHAGVADLIPGTSAEQLAQAYQRAYEERPEDLIVKAMMGRPIEADMKITRAQIWFLLMDGFVGAAAANGRWGTADKQVPDLKSPNTQWSAEEFREVLARLPLISAGSLVTMTAPDAIRQGATAGPSVDVTARVIASAPPLVSRVSGRTLIGARAGGTLSGQEVTWRLHEESLLPELGKVVTPLGTATATGASGTARFTFQPAADPTRGAGQLVDDWEMIEARFETHSLLANAYTVPGPLAALAIGTSRASKNLHLSWRSSDVLWLVIANIYEDVNFEIPGIGGGTRHGLDGILARLTRRQNGDYIGSGKAKVVSSQELRGGACPTAGQISSQQVRVKAERQTQFGPTHVLDDFLWFDPQLNILGTMATTNPDGGYYRVMIYPMTEPTIHSRCILNIPARGRIGWGAEWFIPFNDAQWTTPDQGYGIALRAQGLTSYFDISSLDPLAGGPLSSVKAAFQLNGGAIWTVLAAPTLQAITGK